MKKSKERFLKRRNSRAGESLHGVEVGLVDLWRFGWLAGLVTLGATTSVSCRAGVGISVGCIPTTEIRGLFVLVSAHAQSGDGDAVQRVKLLGLVGTGRVTGTESRTSTSRSRSGGIATLLRQVQALRHVGNLVLGLDETVLQRDNVFTQLVVLGLEGLDGFAVVFVLLDLLLELADVALFTLTEGALDAISMGSSQVARDRG